jgi:hypothetical protein
MLLEGLDDAAGATGDESSRIAGRAEQFAAMGRRVARDFESHPLRDQFIQLLQDERELLDEQIPALVGYLYSSVVNNFKGEVAEILARPVIRRFGDRLGVPVSFVSGWDVAEPQLRTRRVVWAKGADGLLVADGDRLGIVAVIEIKSYRENTDNMAGQARKHVARLRRGLRIGGRELASTDYDFVLSDGSRIPAADAPADVEVASLRIRTPLAPLTSATISDGLTAVAELPFTKAELSKAAFAMTEWFLARLGPIVFHLPGDPRPGAVVTRWPNDSLEHVGRWATREAFFHTSTRLEYYRQRVDSPRTRRALRGTYWLYNAMSFGYEHARGDRMVWVEELMPPPPEVDAGIEAARDHFRAGSFDEVRAVLANMRTKNPNADQLRKIAWLEGMTEYRDVQFEKARSSFPGASGQRSDIWNHRDLLMEARLAARTGRLDNGATKLEHTLALGISSLGFPAECEGVRALVCAARGDHEGVARASAAARAHRAEIARRIDERRADGRADPEVDWQALDMGKLDLAGAAAAAGDQDDAEWWIRSMISRTDSWIPRYVERDPLLASILPRIADWLAAHKS